ncbi:MULTISPECIES: DUF2628 domain-containing protein [unclassified Nocardia]|uniref:DUF2628 domain-containing protein n=1 Tax=unclassified Nocardia TaxID=2637762 RepID=UPI00278C51BC|nr:MULTISPECIES: DUF2628 domain-containing protein [unclassified Nocardia]
MGYQTSTPATYDDLKPKWRERFAFFDSYGHPGAPEYRQAVRGLPFRKQMLVGSNFIAFFFGPIYFFVLGLWRKNLSLLGIWVGVVVAIIALEAIMETTVPDLVARGVGFGMAALYMSTANYAYYLQRTRGIQGWNPFEGMGKRAP